MVETVTPGFPARRDAQNRRGDDLIAKQQHRPVHRAHEFIVAVAPAHPLGNRQASQRSQHDAGNQVGGRCAWFSTEMNQPSALVSLLPLQFGDGDPAGPGKPFGGFSRFPVRAKGGAQRRAAPLALTVGLAPGQLFDQHRQSARGGETMQGAAGQAGFFQSGADPLFKGSRQRQQRFRRQFLGADFDQQVAGVGISHEPPPRQLSLLAARTSESPGRRAHRNRPARPPAPGRGPAG